MKKTTHISLTKPFYACFKANLFTLCLGIFSSFAVKAQTVTTAWAALGSSASTQYIAIDASGNIYATNFGNSTVSKVTHSGTVTQAWATLTTGTKPTGIAIDASGNVYTANFGTNTISKITPSGTLTQAWATLASGAGAWGLAIDGSGNLYTTNYSNNTVSKITSAGVVTPAWATLATGANPFAIAIDASGNVYTGNYSNSTISKITAAGTLTQAWVTYPFAVGLSGMVIDGSGNIFATCSSQNAVSKITPSGTLTRVWASTGSGPYGITMDASGNFYTANNLGFSVSKITSTGTSTNSWAALGPSTSPRGITIDASGNLYTANNMNGTISKITTTVLPVELVDFSGRNTEGGNLLTWTTANDVNNKGFQVERLAPPTPQRGEKWEVLGFVNAKGKAATYDFTDATPPLGAGGLYYRLRQIDNDGKETLSKVISVNTKSSAKLKIYPSVTSQFLTIETTEAGDYQIFNLFGQQVLNAQTGQRVDVSALPQGTYILTVGTEQAKFVKQF